MALAEPADRGIAGHLADGREAVREQNRIGAESGRRRRGLHAGMPASDDDDVRLQSWFLFHVKHLNGFRQR